MRDAIESSKVFVIQRALDPDLQITEFIGSWIKHHSDYPTFQFNNVVGHPSFRIIMNLLKRETLLHSIDIASDDTYLATCADRLATKGNVLRAPSLATQSLRSIKKLPVLRHQPKDVGHYLTSFVACLRNPKNGTYNLGFYRALVFSDTELVIFMDSRTHGHKIVQTGLTSGEDVPITLFNGGALCVYLAAAANVPEDMDSFDAASRLAARAILIDQTEYPPAPIDSEIVIHGRVLSRLETEAPFGEFKGYYCAPTRSPVLQIDRVTVRTDPYYLGIFCGKESGLTLMALPNELLLYSHLRSSGFDVSAVRFPLEAFGEFLTLIETSLPSMELLLAAMDFDKRCKIFIVTDDLDGGIRQLSIFPFETCGMDYIKRGTKQGHRLGILVQRSIQYDWVEL